jgi:hypothetical protein
MANPNAHDPAEFATGMTGSCLCGSVQVTIHDSELFTRRRGHLCHCANCRKSSGSYVASNFLIESDKVEIHDTKGTLKAYADYETISGKPVIRSFCGVDGRFVSQFLRTCRFKFINKHICSYKSRV